ncbi:MAG: thioredoxin-disulfide reductase [Clostridiales bacterium]|nr:thioredoxin-disulfide reductase [Clostridiales bacterium]
MLDNTKIWDVAIIGSGPAGLTAGIYTTRGALSTIIIGGSSWGGQLMLTSEVDNFPGFPAGILGPELMENMKKQALRFGAEFVPSNVNAVDFSKKPFKLIFDEKTIQAKSVIIATGAETKWLGVKGEKELIGRGISSCAPCDAPFFKEKYVLVVGGGDSAMEEAQVLTKYASKVTIIHRRDEFKASKAMQDKVFSNKKIDVIWDSEISEVIGQQKLESVKIKNIKTNIETKIKVDGIFVAIGHNPSSTIFKGLIDLDEKGYVSPKNGPKTNVEGVFVSGDVQDYTYKQAITAAGYGCMAGMEVVNYIAEQK